MKIQKKTAEIRPVGDADEMPGSFEVILSTPALDRDGEEVKTEEWKTPLPDHITFDIDHGMSVATTIGSGVPEIDENGNLIVKGTYSSLPRAQEVRTLVNEGHIRTTSVAFLPERKKQKDGRTTVVRELLNGAFVAIPANPEAVVLGSKTAEVEEKSGARNSANDLEKIQAIHDHSQSLGADCASGVKSLGWFKIEYDDGMDELGERLQALLVGADASLDTAMAILAGYDLTTLPAEIQQALNLIVSADAQVDEILATLGIPDVDEEPEETETTGETVSPDSGAIAPETGEKSAPVEDVDSTAVQAQAIALMVSGFTE